MTISYCTRVVKYFRKKGAALLRLLAGKPCGRTGVLEFGAEGFLGASAVNLIRNYR